MSAFGLMCARLLGTMPMQCKHRDHCKNTVQYLEQWSDVQCYVWCQLIIVSTWNSVSDVFTNKHMFMQCSVHIAVWGTKRLILRWYTILKLKLYTKIVINNDILEDVHTMNLLKLKVNLLIRVTGNIHIQLLSIPWSISSPNGEPDPGVIFR